MQSSDDAVADYDIDEYYVDENANYDSSDAKPDEIKKHVQEMDDELEKLNKMQQSAERQLTSVADAIDEKSVYVGQVDYEATPEELRVHFSPCGTINRVTIMCDKVTGHPKGFAYVEFVEKESVENALKLDESIFKSRTLKVLPKRQNLPISTLRGRGRGGLRGGRSGGRGGIIGGRFSSRGRFNRGRGGPVRGRGRASYYNSFY